MFLALREIRHAKLRYLLITGVIVMVSALVFILSGLSNGLASGNSAAIDALSVDALIINEGSDYQLDRSSLSIDLVDEVASQEGVDDAEPFGATAANVRQNDSEGLLGISIIAVDPEGFAAPEPESGDPLGDENVVVIDQTLENEGVSIGDTLTLDPGGVELEVVGSVSDRSYRLVPTLYMPLSLWQEFRADTAGAEPDAISAVLVQGETEAPDGTMLASQTEIVENLPGYSEQALTLMLIQVFLVVIAAGIVAAFFYIITLQKIPELGVMKAIGTKTVYLAKTLLSQVILLGVAGVIIGMGIAFVVELFIGGTVPFTLELEQFLLYGGILLAVAVIGTLLSLLRVARVDPLDAINNAG